MKLFLNGYFYRNLGDDLFFHIVANRYPAHQFYAMIHKDHASAYTGVPNVKVLPQSKALRGLDQILYKLSPSMSLYARKGRKLDASLLVGGSMFQEMADDGSDLVRLNQMPQNYKNLFIMGINFGPCKTDAYRQAVKRYLSTATDVCFRDKTSYDLFSDLPNTRLGSDIVFGVEALCPKAEETKNTCVISVMDFGAKPALAPYKDAYLAFLERQVLQQQELGRRVILVSFSRAEGDENGIRDLLDTLPEENRMAVETLLYDGQNWKEICGQISAAACLVASRFHSVVLGLCYGVPTVAISYSNKTSQLLKDLGLADRAILPEQLQDMTDVAVIDQVDVAPLKEAAERHFAKLDQFLNGN